MYTSTSIDTDFNYCFLEAASSNDMSGDKPSFRPPITPADFLASNAEYQIAYALAYINKYGVFFDITSGELFNFESVNDATDPGYSSRSAYEGNIGNISFIFADDPNMNANEVCYFSHTKKVTRLLYDNSVNQAWFQGGYGLRLRGSTGNIMTIKFNNYKTFMKWTNFIKDPSGGF